MEEKEKFKVELVQRQIIKKGEESFEKQKLHRIQSAKIMNDGKRLEIYQKADEEHQQTLNYLQRKVYIKELKQKQHQEKWKVVGR